MKKIFTLFLILTTTFPVFSQNVTNVESKQAGNKIEITYYLDKQADIEIQLSEDGGRTFTKITKVSGDIGKNISAGYKKIIWDVLAERDNLQGNNVVFKVKPSAASVLINGVRWATCNVDAPGTFTAKPEDAGMFYQWNRNIGWSSTNLMVNNEGSKTWNQSTSTGVRWEVTNDPCPAGWRVPTKEEIRSLVNSGSTWGKLNGVNGRFFGNGNQKVFLPAAGYRYGSGGTLDLQGSLGYYWSSTPSGSYGAHGLGFGSGLADVGNFVRTCGFSIRCVSE